MKKDNSTALLVAIIGFIGVIMAAIIGAYVLIYIQDREFAATQTAEAKQMVRIPQEDSIRIESSDSPRPILEMQKSEPAQLPTHIPLSPTPTFNPQPTELRLTSNNSHDIQPSFSPNGEKIVFISNRDANPEIYIMDADGSNQKRLTYTPKMEEDLPGFSPDGTKIIFGILNGEVRDLYMMDVDGRNLVNLTNTTETNEARPRVMSTPPLKIIYDAAPVGSETWNIYSGVIADNRLASINLLSMKEGYFYRLASYIPAQNTFISRREVIGQANSSRVIRHNLNTGEEYDISGGHTTFIPQVSPDGKWVFFVSYQGSDCQLFRVSTADWSIAQVPLQYIDIGGIAVSPDGQWLVLSIKQEDMTLDLFRLSFP